MDQHGYVMDSSWKSVRISMQDIHKHIHLGYVTIYTYILGSIWICLMEICKDIHARYQHKISMFGYVEIQ